MKRIFIVSSIVLICGRAGGAGADPVEGARVYLEGKQVRAILQDRNGVYWFGTRHNAVSRYDGKTWKSFSKQDGLISEGVLSIAEGKNGHLWFAGGGGLQSYDGKQWTAYPLQDVMPAGGRVAFSVRIDREGNIWMGTNAGAGRFDGRSWTTFSTRNGLGGNVVHDILVDASGHAWFATRRSGLSRYDGEQWTVFHENRNCRQFLEDSTGKIWVGMSQGVMTFDGTEWSTLVPDQVMIPQVEDARGAIWFATEGAGAVRFDGESWTTYGSGDGLPSDVVFAVYVDASGAPWVGTDDGAVRLELE